MIKLINDTLQIAKKDLTEFRRDKIRLITFIIMPIFMMVLTGFIFPSQNSLNNIKLGIANQDNGLVANQLVQVIHDLKVSNKQAFIISNYNDIDGIKDAIKSQKVSGGLVIPAGFSDQLKNNQQAEVTIVEDQSNPQIMGLITQSLSGIISGFGQQIAVQKVIAVLQAQKQAAAYSPLSLINPIISKLQGLVSGNINYFDFVAPGIMAMVVMTAVLTGLAASVAREKEQGTLDGILIAPIGRLSIVLGKALSQSIRGLFQGAIVLLLSIFLFGVTIHGSLLLVALILLLGIFSFVGLGILVSASATEQETATQFLFMFQFPMLFLSGAFFPIQQMPNLLQKVAHILPLTYGVEALRKVMVLGAGIGAVRTEILVLLGFGLITLLIAVPSFKRMVTK